jgi:hypothetical protein
VSLFAYDNKSFVVESYLDTPTQVTVSTASSALHLRNLTTGEVMEGKPTAAQGRRSRAGQRTEFKFDVPPHSFLAFGAE